MKKAFLAFLAIVFGEAVLAKVMQFVLSVPYAEIKIAFALVVMFLMVWWPITVLRRVWPDTFG